MIYLDNSATGGYKPNCVIKNVAYVIKKVNANPGRSGHKLSEKGAKIIYETRRKLSYFFNNGCTEKVIFTKNCSEALNTAIYGTMLLNSHVITTVFEHNSTLRPLFNLKNKGIIDLTIVAPKNKHFITSDDIAPHIKPNTKLVCVNNISNVNGNVNNISEIGLLCKQNNITFLVDGAQSGGHIKIDMQRQNIDILALAGHKGLFGIAGSGVLIFQKHVEISSTFQGGTGTESFNLSQPDVYPEKLEYGTLNLPAICSLNFGIAFLEKNLNNVNFKLYNLSDFLINNLLKINKIKVYSTKNPAGIVAFSIDGYSSQEVAEILSTKYDILVRGGFHCAPLMHNFLNTKDGGLVRVSIGYNNTKKELLKLVNALLKITYA